MDDEPLRSRESREDELGQIAEELWALAERSDDPQVRVDGSEAAEQVHSVTTSTARARL